MLGIGNLLTAFIGPLVLLHQFANFYVHCLHGDVILGGA
jgi:hypothetical protein